jgi:hypothetical protein
MELSPFQVKVKNRKSEKTTSQNLNLVFAYDQIIKPHSDREEVGFW